MNNRNPCANTYDNNGIISGCLFTLFVLFVLFFTNSMFPEPNMKISDLSEFNIINRISYIFFFTCSLLCLKDKINAVISILWEEKFLSLFMIWCVFSLIWTDNTFDSLKKIFLTTTSLLVVLSFIINAKDDENLINFINLSFILFILISAFSIILVPGAVNPYGGFRGLSGNKSSLGQACLVSCLSFFLTNKFYSRKKKYFLQFMFIVSAVMIIGSQSLTSILTLFIFLFAFLIFSTNSLLARRLGIGNFFLVVATTIITSFIFTILITAPELITEGLVSFGKDPSLTGRTNLWGDILIEAKKHLIIGTGYGGFWTLNNNVVLNLYEKYTYLPRQSHQGYLDILNETGLIGITLILLIIFNYIRKINKTNCLNWPMWFFWAALIFNFTESTIFRPKLITGIMFTFSYLLVYCHRYRD